jgi:SWI/SNF-related matrix-associated actin-dependent regulator 1 of chromatin subfamily A
MHQQSTLRLVSRGWWLLTYRFEDADDRQNLVDLTSILPGMRLVQDESAPEVVKVEVPANVLPTTAFEPYLQSDYSRPLPPPIPLAEANRPLYPHQAQAALWLLDRQGGLLADDMGLGKTATAATAAVSYRQWRQASDHPILIIGPSYVENVWRRELVALGFLDDPKSMAAARGTQPYEANLAGTLDSGFLFVPYHLMGDWVSFCRLNRKGRPIAVIMDEAHWIKNPKSKRGSAAATASKICEFRVLLTGTPMSNRPSELWNVLSALDGTGVWGSHFEFRTRYCGAMHDGHGYKDMGPTRTKELSARMAERYMRRTATDVDLDLPPFRRETLMVEPTDEMRLNHEDLMEGWNPATLLEALRDHKLSRDVLRQMTRLRKYTSRCKVYATVDFIKECQSQGQSVVVFVWEKAIANRIAKKVGGIAIHGDIPVEDRQEGIDWFQAEGGALVATLDSLKEGVTLTKASRVIMHDLSWVPSDILQAEARVNRIGQTQPVIATWMLIEDSFDVLLASCLSDKAEDIAQVLGIEDAKSMASVFDSKGISGLSSAVVDAEAMIRSWIGRTE